MGIRWVLGGMANLTAVFDLDVDNAANCDLGNSVIKMCMKWQRECAMSWEIHQMPCISLHMTFDTYPSSLQVLQAIKAGLRALEENLCDLAFDHINHENVCLMKFSRYTVWDQRDKIMWWASDGHKASHMGSLPSPETYHVHYNVLFKLQSVVHCDGSSSNHILHIQ